MTIQLFDIQGNRLYLTQDERRRFLDTCKGLKQEARTYCETLALTGCRESEPLEVLPQHVILDEKAIVFRTLKKRRQDVYRRVPISEGHLDTLCLVHRLREPSRADKTALSDHPLWGFTRMTGYRYVKQAMEAAGIEPGPHRTPKGLRHAFGVHAIMQGVPIIQLQVWMGHAKLETTAAYLNVMGKEEREIAARMWV
jgi:integrase/recombinase XerD|tara:strand:- start:1645 stop:2235 length:591 start_codon:yes stop_codon:yes gene_type:complete